MAGLGIRQELAVAQGRAGVRAEDQSVRPMAAGNPGPEEPDQGGIPSCAGSDRGSTQADDSRAAAGIGKDGRRGSEMPERQDCDRDV